MPPITNDWLEMLKPEFGKEYYKKLYKKVIEEYNSVLVYPPVKDDLFNAFHYTPLSNVKVVILGQDPLSWGRTGTWLVFFGKKRRRYPAVSG